MLHFIVVLRPVLLTRGPARFSLSWAVIYLEALCWRTHTSNLKEVGLRNELVMNQHSGIHELFCLRKLR